MRIRIDDFLKKFDENDYFWEYLDDYFQENYFCRLDRNYDCLITFGQPCIIINDDGDVYDQETNKFFIDHDDYETEEERNQLIENYMEKTGVYSGIFTVDRYGNVNIVITNK